MKHRPLLGLTRTRNPNLNPKPKPVFLRSVTVYISALCPVQWKTLLDIEMIARAVKAELRHNLRHHMQKPVDTQTVRVVIFILTRIFPCLLYCVFYLASFSCLVYCLIGFVLPCHFVCVFVSRLGFDLFISRGLALPYFVYVCVLPCLVSD